MYRAKKGMLLAKIEATYGTDPTPTVASNFIAAAGGTVSWTPNFERLSRMIADGSTSKVTGYNVQPTVGLTFTVEARGNRTSGATDTDISDGTSAFAVDIDCLLKACDLTPTYTAETGSGARDGYVTYKPTTPDNEGSSVTFYFYRAGKLHKVTGAKGTVRGIFEAGKIAKFEFTFQGLWNLPTDASMPSMSSPLSTVPPLFRSATGTIGAFSPVFRNFTFDLGNNIVRRDSGNAATGVVGFLITSRNPKVTIDPEATLEATKAIFGNLESSTNQTITATLGSATGNKVKVTAVCEPVSSPYGEENEIITHAIEYEVCRAALSDTANDEFQLKFF